MMRSWAPRAAPLLPPDPGPCGGGARGRGRSPPPGENRAVPTARQLRKYGRLFESLTRGRQFEAVSGPEAQELFHRSGLGDQVLAHIWALSDHDQDGCLIWPEFVLAMHLVRRQLAGQPPPPPGPGALPPELVHLLGTLAPATEFASQPSRSPRSLSATRPARAFDASPVRSASPAGRADAPPPGGCAGPCSGGGGGGARGRGRSPPPGENRTVPTARQLRKYGRLFESMTRGRQFEAVSGPEAQELFHRSGLSDQVLAHIWALSDHDQDGYLIWPEFVLAMHLVRRQLAGQPPPPPGPGALPPELVHLLGTLAPATEFASQPSRSPRSLSATRPARAFDASPARSASPAGRAGGPDDDERRAAWPAPEGCGAGAFGRDAFGGGEGAIGKGGDRGDAFGDATTSAFHDAFGGDGGALEGGSLGGADGHKKHKKHEHHKKKHRHHEEEPPDHFASAPAAAEGPGLQLGSTTAAGQAAATSELPLPSFGREGGREPGELGSSSVGERRRPRARRRTPRDEPELPQAPGSGASAVEHVEVLAEADRVIMQQLRRDTDGLDAELARLDDLCRQEALAMAREQDETARLRRERELLEGQLAGTRRALDLLRSEHRDLRMESVLLRRDHGHYDREAAFLQRLFDEGTREAQLLLGSVEALELSSQSLQAHTAALEEAHHKVLQDLRAEEELLAREEQECQAARQQVESLRSGVPAASAPLAAAAGGPPRPLADAFGLGAGAREPGHHRAAAHNEGV